MEVLVPVCRKEPGQGIEAQLCFSPETGTDKPAHGTIGGLKGGVKQGLLPRQGRAAGRRIKTPAEQFELSRGSAPVPAFKNNKIAYDVHAFSYHIKG
ncbi:hypothetical protein FACS1894110_00090 [Spirochaetia bacterium]|nr:hypothetical protein FACS1894110_00090 [Spirochaetia bacterium]